MIPYICFQYSYAMLSITAFMVAVPVVYDYLRMNNETTKKTLKTRG